MQKIYKNLKDNILNFTNKTSKVVGVDKSLDLSYIADEINELINKKL